MNDEWVTDKQLAAALGISLRKMRRLMEIAVAYREQGKTGKKVTLPKGYEWLADIEFVVFDEPTGRKH